jgi:hypothetical protein
VAFPTVVNTATSMTTANTTTAVITMPASIVAGRLLIMQLLTQTAVTSAPGFTQLGTLAPSGAFSYAYAKIAAGSDTCTVTFATGTHSAIVYQVDGWSGTLSDVKYAGTVNVIDPPSLTMPSSADHLWLAASHKFGGALTVPTNYSSMITVNNTGNFFQLFSAVRSLTATTENPGTYGGTASVSSAWTLGVPPGSNAVVVDISDVYARHRGPNYRR